jgi:hypothetical protein
MGEGSLETLVFEPEVKVRVQRTRSEFVLTSDTYMSDPTSYKP